MPTPATTSALHLADGRASLRMPDVALRAPDQTRPSARRPGGLLLRRLEDRRLCELVASGDDRAFEVLYDRHHQPLLAFCRHTLSRREEGEDALQQTFLRAHQALRAGRIPDDLRPWLFTIARNRCRTMLAARRDRAEVPEAAAGEQSVAGLATEVGRREDLRALLADLGDLAEEQRTALVLCEVADMRHEQIAAVLEVDVSKVRQLVYQARTNLLAQREAREAPCASIREQLATARGGVLRRGPLRRHLKLCDPCRTFATAVAQQRVALGIALPVAPTAGLKAGLLGILGTGSGAKLAAGGSLGASLAANVTAAKVVVALAVAGASAGGAAAVAEPDAPRPATTASVAPAPAKPATFLGAGVTFTAAVSSDVQRAAALRTARQARRARRALRRMRRATHGRRATLVARRRGAARQGTPSVSVPAATPRPSQTTTASRRKARRKQSILTPPATTATRAITKPRRPETPPRSRATRPRRSAPAARRSP